MSEPETSPTGEGLAAPAPKASASGKDAPILTPAAPEAPDASAEIPTDASPVEGALDAATAPTAAYRDAEPEVAVQLAPLWMRAAFLVGWFVVAPFLIAQSRELILLSLPRWAWVDTVRGQPIPVGIVLFTLSALILWHYRFWLPGASAAGIGGRPGLPASTRKRFEAARQLRDEARAIRRAHAKEIERHMREEHRTELDAALVELDAAMDASSFDAQRFETAYETAAQLVDDRLGRWRKGELREYGESIAVAVTVALGIRAFVIEAFKIPSGSMIPTLLVGDHIFVNKLAYGPLIPFTHKRLWTSMPPSRGDVIVFAFPENPEEDFIKRVIALPGDKLEVREERIWLNDKPIPRCFVGRTSYVDLPETLPMTPTQYEGDLYVEYLDGQSYLTLYTLFPNIRKNAGPWYPQQGEVWVLGDNRNNSRDSREWWQQKGGGVPYENIRGRALWIWLSYTSNEGSKSERIGASVMGSPRLPVSMLNMRDQAGKAVSGQAQLDRCLAPDPPLDKAGLPP